MLQRLDHDGPILSIAFRPDAQELASASKDGTVRLWRSNRDGRLAMEKQPIFAKIVALSPDGQWLASLEDDHRIRLRNVATGKLEREAKVREDPIALAVNGDRRVFALAIKASEVARWDVFSDGKVGGLHARKVLVLSPNAKWAVCTNDTGVLMVNAETGDRKPIVPYETAPAASKGIVSAVNASDKFAISHSGGLIVAYDVSAKRIILCANPCLPAVRGTSFAPGGEAETFTVHTQPLDPQTAAIDLKRTIPCEARLTHLAFAANERLLFATTQENDLLLFDLKMGRQVFRREVGGPVASLCTSGTQPKLACALEDQPMRLWGDAEPADPSERERIAGVRFKDFDLVKLPESEISAQASSPMDTFDAAFWDAIWETKMRVEKLTGQNSAEDLREAYAPVREVFAHGEPLLSWQVAAMRQRLAVTPSWSPADAAALRARFDAIDELEPPERVIVLRDGILPFGKDDATIRAAARFRLAGERMANGEERSDDGVKQCAEAMAAGYTDVDEIFERWPIEKDLRSAEIFERELLPRIPNDRKADRTKVFIVLAETHAAAWAGTSNTELDLAFKALEEAVALGFQDWAAEWSRIEKLTDDPRFKLEWLPSDALWVNKLVRKAVRFISQNTQTGTDRALRLLRAALDRDPKNYPANFSTVER